MKYHYRLKNKATDESDRIDFQLQVCHIFGTLLQAIDPTRLLTFDQTTTTPPLDRRGGNINQAETMEWWNKMTNTDPLKMGDGSSITP